MDELEYAQRLVAYYETEMPKLEAEAAQLREALKGLLDATKSFLASPPRDMMSRKPFGQYTTAGDCLRLSTAWNVAHAVIRRKGDAMLESQVQATNEPPPKTWDDYERGCVSTYRGGHEGKEADAFVHGMRTVFNLLRVEFPCPDRKDFTMGRAELLRIWRTALDQALLSENPDYAAKYEVLADAAHALLDSVYPPHKECCNVPT